MRDATVHKMNLEHKVRRFTLSMEGHTHFRYRMSSALARPIIHGGRSLIVVSLSRVLSHRY